jgi:PTS system nitrogen regulatory IIA component
MRITDILEPTAVLDDVAGSTAAEVLTQICEPLATTTGVDAQRLVEALLARERQCSTGVGDGVAIPHAKVAGLRGLVAGFGRSRAGIDFKALDSKPTTLFFVLLAPEGVPGLHLNALARISRLFKSAAFRESLLRANGAAEILQLIATADTD